VNVCQGIFTELAKSVVVRARVTVTDGDGFNQAPLFLPSPSCHIARDHSILCPESLGTGRGFLCLPPQ
jgi:hypothetical protein